MQIVKYFEVHDVYSDDGYGPTKVIGRFSNHDIANRYAKGRGNYNHDAKVTEVEVIICDNFKEIEEMENRKLRESALKKLTDAERKALGV